MTKKEQKEQEARERLRAILKPSDTILIVIKSVSRSGMSRRMRVYTRDFRDISWLVADLCDIGINDTGLNITGCGMDMTFWLADIITHYLWQGKKPRGLKGNGGSCIKWEVA